jgi:hypothetical protein
MTTIVTRSGKGSPLTHTEVDTNFTNLNTAKLETAAIPLGTLQAPSVSFLNDSDTGIFCPQGGNSLAIATGGQYAITCSSTQAVGIKTANPQGALQVAGSTRIGANDATDAFLEIGEGATGNRNSYIDIVGDTTYTDYGLRVIRNNTGANATSELKHRGTGALNFTTEEAAPIVFYTTNSPALTILAGGNVGIGTSSPGELLQVGGFSGSNGITIGAGSSNYSFIYLADGTGGTEAYRGYLQYDHATDKLELGSAGATAVTVDSLQRVGIGTTSPGEKLHVSGGKIKLTGTAGGGAGGGILSGEVASELHIQSEDYTGASFADIVFDAGNGSGSYFERARIDSSGRLLVGTTSALVDGFNNAFTSSQLSKGSANDFRCISDTRSVAAVNNSTVDVWVVRTAAGNPFNNGLVGHFYVQVGGANAFSGVYSIVTTGNGTSSATLTAVSTVTRGTSPVSSVQIANDGVNGAIKLTITYINNAGVVDGLTSYVSFIGLAAP